MSSFSHHKHAQIRNDFDQPSDYGDITGERCQRKDDGWTTIL